MDAAAVLDLADALLEAGALSVDVTDAEAGTHRETPRYGEPGEAPEVAFGLNRVAAMFAPDVDWRQALQDATRSAGLATTPAHQVRDVPQQDWVRLTQSQFEPIRISARLWIVPSWHVAPDPAAINIVLDPGLAFGTGSHPTTRLCLDWLERNLAAGSSVIDYGCGSGILAIAAAKLGAASVVGVDIDEQAVAASRYNALNNGVSATFANAAQALPEPAEVVIANILSNPLKVLAPVIASLVRPGGHAVLSGILAHQASEVRAFYLPWFEMEPPAEQDGWVRLAGIRQEVTR